MKLDQSSNSATDQPDDIVITGMSGTFPGSVNIDEFEHKLYNKIDMVSKETRFDFIYLDQPERAGIIPVNDKFDCGFFGIHERQAEFMDAAIRIFLEKCTEAIIDAGLHPEDLENTRTGVFVGSCVSESEIFMSRKKKPKKSFFWTGNARCMITNRISYFFKLKGPSFTTDTACSSSLYALEHAYRALRNGDVDMAIVGGTNLCSFAGTTIQFARLGVLSHDGICKVFDEKANGYVRAEGICALLLQKRKDANRIYCSVVHAKTNCDGYKEEGITYPSGEAQLDLLTEFYQECGVDPSQLSYLEAHGTGTKVGDPEECESIDQIFTKNRERPLLIGSVKSCVGHSEPVSGCISIVKSILALEKGEIAPNLHFHTPKPEIKAIVEGRLKVVTDVTKLEDDRGLIGINSFGFGGGNCHILIKGNMKQKVNNGIPRDDLSRLVCFSGRTEEAIKTLCNYVNEVGIDAEFISLLHNAFRKNIATHLYRGYIVISKSGVIESSVSDGTFAPWNIPPLTIVLGDLNDWYSVLKNFREVGIFSESLKGVAKVLSSINLDNTILSGKIENRNAFDILGNIITQICIVDLLKELNIIPKITVGYSFGELVSAYVEGVLKLDEVLQCAYIFNHELCNDSKINVSLTNGAGNYEADKQNQSPLRKNLVKNLQNVLNRPKTWRGKVLTAEHFVDAALKHKLEKLQNDVTSNSVILEIGSNGWGINENEWENITLLRTGETFNDFLSVLGSLYQVGYNPVIQKLYPSVQFPVSRGTPRISSKIKWNHRRSYITRQPPRAHVYTKSFTVDLRKPDWMYISGHMIDGRILFPAAGYLYLAWDVFAEEYKVQDALAVTFENVKFIRATSILPSDPVTLVVVISDSGYFEITERDSIVVTGRIKEVPEENKAYYKLPTPVADDHEMNAKDIYKELRLRGYNYQGQFQAMESCDVSCHTAKIQWIENYVTFIDNLFQLKVLNNDTRLLFVPTHLFKLTILPIVHRKFVKGFENQEEVIKLPVFYSPECDIIRCGGIEVQGMLASPIPRKKNLASPVLESFEFVPNETELPLSLSIRLNSQIMSENLPFSRTFPSLEIVDLPPNTENPESLLLTTYLMEAIDDIPLIQSEAKVFSATPLELKNVNVVTNGNLRAESKAYAVVMGTKLLQKKQVLDDAIFALVDNGFIISRESKSFKSQDVQHPELILLTVHRNEEESIIMLGKSQKLNPVYMKLENDPEFTWLPKLQSLAKTNNEIVIYIENDTQSGIMGFINCWRKEPDVKSVRAVFIMDNGKTFDASEPLFAEQLKKNLTLNVFKNGQWGTYRHLPIDQNQEVKTQHIFLNQTTVGDLSSLKWMAGPLSNADITEIPPIFKLVEVHYASLNFKDIMVASGKLSADAVNGYCRTQLCDIGMEYSGIDQNGQRVMGMASVGALASRMLEKSIFAWSLPDDWTLADGATVPIVYTTLIYGLCLRGNMKRGESILIHSGLGGVGQAAINYCLFNGLNVFTTVGSEKRKEVLMKLFPQIPENHIGNSHDTSFEQMIMRETNGRGVDLVLNSLAEEKLLASVRCLARGGRMIEIGKYDIKSNNLLNLHLFKKEASFHGVMLDMFLTLASNDLIKVSRLLTNGVKEGSVKPLNKHVFKIDEVEQAFRFMAAGKHLGKVVLEVRPEEKIIDLTKLHAEEFSGSPRFNCDPKKSYILIGGLGGFGLELADWLVLRGAKQLVLSSRKGFSSGYQRKRVSIWESYGVVIHISTQDLSTKQGCIHLIEEAQELGPVDVIVNLAVNLQDAIFDNQTAEMFKASFTPKPYVTKYLDEVTRKMCPDLREFIVFSSVSCGKGNAGQTNYGMANSIMERICEQRQKDGYPGKAIEWGAIGEVGLLGEMDNNATETQIGGTLLQKISSCLQVMDILLAQPSPVVSSIVVAEKTRGVLSTENAVEAVASILGVTDLKTVSLHSTLAEIGMDSMTSVEIKQMLEREFDIFLSPKEIRTLTLAKLQEIQNSKETGQAESGESSNDVPNINQTVALLFEMIDETESKILCVKMQSKIEDSVKAPTVLMVPGLEGFAKVMEPLSHNLEAHVYGLQLDYEACPDTIFDMAQQKLSLAEQHLSKDKPFQIIAHSYGVAETLEMVSLLEAKGYSGTVYCIDGSPLVMHEFANILGKTEDEVESNFILRLLMFYDVPAKGMAELAMEFQKFKTVDEKIDRTLELYADKLPLSTSYLRKLILGTTKRILAIKNYKPSYSHLKSELVLFRPSVSTFGDPSDDMGLTEICKKNIAIYTIEGNHLSILKNDELAKIINSSF